MMVRSDRLGVTSIVRALELEARYEALYKFFRSDAWELKALEQEWAGVVAASAPIMKFDGGAVLVGDGVKESKEGKRMPGVKRLHQESENSSKAPSITGQMFGSVGVLAEGGGKTFCMPLACEMQDGVKTILKWDKNKRWVRQGSHVVEMITLAHEMTKVFSKATLLLDRYFLTRPALDQLDVLNKARGGGLRLIVMAKSNMVAYKMPESAKSGTRGRPKKKGDAIKFAELFESEADNFITATVQLYGKDETVRYHVKDLLWGKGRYRKMRFVLAEISGRRVIISSTDTGISGIDIIMLYSRRFSIECTFKSMKQDAAAFSNRFWSKHMPKLNRYEKAGEPDRATKVKEKHARECVRKSLDATEGYVFCGVVATGLLQMLSLQHSQNSLMGKPRYLRTKSKTAESEATVSDYLKRNIFRLLYNDSNLPISAIILDKMGVEKSRFPKSKAG
jgi:hypothetical protein